MTVRLPEDVETSINAEVQSGRFASVGEAIAAAWRAFHRLEQPASAQPIEPAEAENPQAEPRKPIWEVFQEISATIPDEEWAKLPTDGAEQHDHYIYGTPKRPPS